MSKFKFTSNLQKTNQSQYLFIGSKFTEKIQNCSNKLGKFIGKGLENYQIQFRVQTRSDIFSNLHEDLMNLPK